MLGHVTVGALGRCTGGRPGRRSLAPSSPPSSPPLSLSFLPPPSLPAAPRATRGEENFGSVGGHSQALDRGRPGYVGPLGPVRPTRWTVGVALGRIHHRQDNNKAPQPAPYRLRSMRLARPLSNKWQYYSRRTHISISRFCWGPATVTSTITPTAVGIIGLRAHRRAVRRRR